MTTADAAYDVLVSSDEQTCPACPTQWEGILRDGRTFYFRYRHGSASLTLNHDDDLFAAVQIGDGLDGTMDDETYRKVFVALLALIDATMPTADDEAPSGCGVHPQAPEHTHCPTCGSPVWPEDDHECPPGFQPKVDR